MSKYKWQKTKQERELDKTTSLTKVNRIDMSEAKILQRAERNFKLQQKKNLKLQEKHDKELYKIMFGK